MKDLLVFTAANGHYLDYLPLWRWCLNKSYPEYDCFGLIIQSPPVKYYSAIYRLLHHPSADFDYIYTTDVDIMHLRHTPTILEYHLAKMKKTGLSYSNSPRTSEHRGKERLTGLHFASQKWYMKTQGIRDAYLHMLDSGEIGNSRFDDEFTLMKICKESKLEIPPHEGLVKRHMGIHMGTLRAYKTHTKQKMNQQLRMRITPAQAKQWLSFYQDSEFRLVLEATCNMNRELKIEFERLYSFCRRVENEETN